MTEEQAERLCLSVRIMAYTLALIAGMLAGR